MAASNQSSFLLSAADVSWGRRECYEVTVTVAATALDGKYFVVDVPSANFSTTSERYVWFNLDGGSVDPAPAGRTGLVVAVVTGDTAADVTTKFIAAVEADAEFRSVAVANSTVKATLEAEFKGPVDAAAADVDTTFTLTRAVVGVGGDLGQTIGGCEVSFDTTSVVITVDQKGALPQDEVFTGSTVEVTVSFAEMTPARWETIVGSVVGDVYTPSGGTQLVGFGESRLYQSFFDLGGELVLHPTRYPASDRSRDIVLWKSAPKPGSINFSGEEAQVMEVTFTGLQDRTLNSNINLFAFGDNQQDVRA